jgi:Flp pilus assembly pilin Flp
MKITKMMLKRLWKDESGQDLTEYALLLALVLLAAIASVSQLGTAVNTAIANVPTTIQGLK